MTYNPQNHHRRSIRLPQYDYTQPGAYFITIVTHNRQCLFGEIANGNMQLNEYGKIVWDEWLYTEKIRNRVILDEFIVMPNHLHGIIILNDGDCCRGTLQRAPTTTIHAQTTEQFGKPTSDSIPTIIRLFKSTTTKQINQQRNTPGMPVWQRNYYEHIIRNNDELIRIREYIINNPKNWKTDENYYI